MDEDNPKCLAAEYWWGEAMAANASGPVWLGVTNFAIIRDSTNAINPDVVTKIVGNEFVPQTPQTFAYDADGNLTNDGRWSFTWDGENRLTKQESLANAPSGSKLRLTFGYDSQSRRIRKTVESWSNGSWVKALDNRFLYDGWNLLAELNATNNALIRSYVWGLDLSGSLQGAGGVGGLLGLNDSANGFHFVAYDGNGNVAALVKGSDGTASANYEYGPFGEVIRATGSMAVANPMQFSTKFVDAESGQHYYGYRSYNPKIGRWLSRDLVIRKPDENLYSLCANEAIASFDPDGRFRVSIYLVRGVPWALPLLCGGWNIQFRYDLNLPPGSYFVVQQITKVEKFHTCDGKTKTDLHRVFFEAKEYGIEYTQFIVDDSIMTPHLKTQGGPASVSAVAKVFHSRDVMTTILLWGQQIQESHTMCSTSVPPWWWNLGWELDSGERSASVDSWDCCCDPPDNGKLRYSPSTYL